MSRGMMTDKIQEAAKDFLEREMTTRELRLIPYLNYTLVNSQVLTKVSKEEKGILAILESEGHIIQWAPTIKVTKEYWDFCNEILWLSYIIGRES